MSPSDISGVPARTARRRRPTAAAEPRWAVLWRELASARERLAEHERRAGGVETLFRTRIEPRERLLTLGVLRVTEALVDRYAGDDLARADRSLLGLWVNEHLESLSDHPYAPREPVLALAMRWRALLDEAGDAPPDPSDPASASYRTMPIARSAAQTARIERDAISRYLGTLFERGVGTRLEPALEPSVPDEGDVRRRQDGGQDGAATHGAHEIPDDTGSASQGDADASDRGEEGRPAPSAGAPVAGISGADGVHTVIETLFRRLARVLHPDREPDEATRDLKHVLMSTALAARRAKDLDTLLSLHVEHAGALPEALDGADSEALVRALERQLVGMRRALDRALGGDPFRAELLLRYDGADEAARARRVAAHAQRLDAETARMGELVARLATLDGLEDALDDRREIERDRLSLDELADG